PDDMTVIDPTQVSAAEPLAAEFGLARVVRLDPVFVDPHAQGLADEARRDRVGAVLHPEGAPLADGEMLLGELRQPRHVERAHRGEVLRDTVTSNAVGLAEHLLDERLPRLDALEVTAAPDEQRLVEPALDRAVARLGVAVLLLGADLRRAG